MNKISPSSFKLLNKPVFIENLETKRYLFSDGAPIKGNRGAEGGWKASSGFESPNVVGADANYYNRAIWIISQSGNNFMIENQETKRYLFSDGAPIKGDRGAEGGWKASSGFESPKVVGADANYYNRALWNIYQSGNNFIIENQETKRYLFADGAPIKGDRGAEGGWKASSGFESPNVVGADANYYNRALWQMIDLSGDNSDQPVSKEIKSLANDLVLDVAGGQTSAGTNVLGYASNGSDRQKWEILSNGVIKSKLGDYALDMKDIPNYEWAKELVINPINGSATQEWEIGADGTIKNKSNGWAIALYDDGNYQVGLVWYLGAPAKPFEKWQVV